MRGWWRRGGPGLLLVLGLVAAAGDAHACAYCSPYSYCISHPMTGALLCYADGLTCIQSGRCRGGMMMEDGVSFALTILENVTLGGTSPFRTIALGAEPGVGTSAARLAMRALGGASEPAIVEAGLGLFMGGTALFRTPAGDGFALRIEPGGEQASVAVSGLAGGNPARPLALAELGKDEALVVHVPFEGRTRVLVLTVAGGPEAERAARDAKRREVLRAGPTPRRADPRPPFEVSVLDR